MDHLTIFAIAVFILLFGLISKRIQSTPLTAPIMFVLYGLLIGSDGLGYLQMQKDHEGIHLLAELTLVLVLFTDASRMDLARFRHEHGIPLRMLGIGLPLCMVLGTLAALPLFPELRLLDAIVLAIVLAPTDAALGQVVVTSERVPVRIRQALNVESGLNDGLALPVLVFFMCLAVQHGKAQDQNFLWVVLQQITLGTLAGVFIGYVGARLVDWGHGRWMSHEFVALSSVGLALCAYAGAELLGGNGFIAAFVSGAFLGNSLKSPSQALIDFGETEGQLLTLLTFLFFGALMVPPALERMDWRVVVYALLSLTVVRMVPVAVSLIGMKLKPLTVGFLGWFGPRGVASIIYALMLLEEANWSARSMIFDIAVVVVLFSVFAHGLSAWPLVHGYERLLAGDEGMPEHVEVTSMPLRCGNPKG